MISDPRRRLGRHAGVDRIVQADGAEHVSIAVVKLDDAHFDQPHGKQTVEQIRPGNHPAFVDADRLFEIPEG